MSRARLLPETSEAFEGCGRLWNTLGQVDAAAHGNTVYRCNKSDHKQHAIAHFCICQLSWCQQVENAEML